MKKQKSQQPSSEALAPLLPHIDSPEDLRALSERDLPRLAEEIRRYLVDHVSETGGHLASNLGVVELTIALHRVLDTPSDRVIWDVGHQSYVHKILTGRKDAFDTLRTPGGLSGFTRRAESPYDPFGAGHSSTSLSAAIGFAAADRLRGSDATTVAVIGDGAFSGGMLREALNNCDPHLHLIAVLNENEMSIGPTTGPVARHISRLRTTASYYRLKRRTAKALRRIPLIGRFLYRTVLRIKIFFKNLLYGTNYYEDLGFFYMGPIDGHDVSALEAALRDAKSRGCSVLLHIKTKKGKGYPPAEADPGFYHSVYQTCPNGMTFHTAVGETLCRMAERDRDLVAVTAAMADGTGLLPFAGAFCDRFFDVGIAEEHAVTFAAGLAANGAKPFVALYSTFLQRAYDQILHDVALQNLPVRFCIDRAGLAYGDGPTHNGIFDVAFLSEFANIVIYTPAALGALQTAMERMLAEDSAPTAVRYPNQDESPEAIRCFYPDGDYSFIRVRPDKTAAPDCDCAIITYGHTVTEALKAKELLAGRGHRALVLLLEALTPYAETAAALLPCLPVSGPVVFLEEGVWEGGGAMCLGAEFSRVSPSVAARYIPLAIRSPFAVPDAPTCDLRRFFGVSAEDVAEVVESAMRAAE